jgi:hypothetical protein
VRVCQILKTFKTTGGSMITIENLNDTEQFHQFLVSHLSKRIKNLTNENMNCLSVDGSNDCLRIMGAEWGVRSSFLSGQENAISNCVFTLCAAGGLKWFIDLLKIWVEERKGRKIKIKHGNNELEIVGGVSEQQLKKVALFFEEEINKTKSIIR